MKTAEKASAAGSISSAMDRGNAMDGQDRRGTETGAMDARRAHRPVRLR